MQVLLVIHNLLRWIVLLSGLWAVVGALSGLTTKKEFSPANDRSNFFFVLSMDLQWLVGLALYFTGSWFERLRSLGENMKDPTLRFFTLEHGLLMIVAWILVHVGKVSVKKAATSAAKFRRSLIFFGIALLLILLAIPWPFREAVMRPLFRWF